MRNLKSSALLLSCWIIFFLCQACSVKGQVTSAINKIAEKAYASGNKEVENGNLSAAKKYFIRASQSAPDWIEPLIKLGALTLQEKNYLASKSYFEKALALDSLEEPLIFLKLGEIAWLTKDYSQVEERLLRFLHFDKINASLKKKAEKYLRDAAFLNRQPPQFDIKIMPLPGTINTEALEYLPSLPAREDAMIFTRRVNGQEDFFLSRFEENQWQPSTPVYELNTPQNEGAHCLSADGKLLVFTACGKIDGLGSCDLYYSTNDGKRWSPPANLGPLVNSKHWDGQPSLSANGKTLYFSSERPGGKGGRDIWSVDRQGGSWGEPINLASINTEWNEEAPFIHAADENLYFMSDGHPGFGGIDLFVSKKAGKIIAAPTNLGAPINTVLDEGALHLTIDGTRAYFARSIPQENRATPEQVDIYEFEVPKDIRPTPATYLQLIVIDATTKAPIQSAVKILDLLSNQTYSYSLTDDQGELLVCLPAGKDFALHVKKEHYIFYSENFNFLDTASLQKPHQLVVALNRITPGDTFEVSKPIVLNNVFFESGSAKLLAKSDFELEDLSKLLMDNASLHIKISGHTDNIGSEPDNQSLSEARAKAIYDYLISKDIDPARLSYQGYGETQPIADNDTESGRQKNRRTEFTVLK